MGLVAPPAMRGGFLCALSCLLTKGLGAPHPSASLLWAALTRSSLFHVPVSLTLMVTDAFGGNSSSISDMSLNCFNCQEMSMRIFKNVLACVNSTLSSLTAGLCSLPRLYFGGLYFSRPPSTLPAPPTDLLRPALAAAAAPSSARGPCALLAFPLSFGAHLATSVLASLALEERASVPGHCHFLVLHEAQPTPADVDTSLPC